MVQGQVMIGGFGQNWRFGRTLDNDAVKKILKKAFCDEIPSGSIVPGSCDLQLIGDYDPATGVANYIITFDILEPKKLENDLGAINNGIKDIIAKNPDVPQAIKDSVTPGTISKCIPQFPSAIGWRKKISQL